MIDTAVLAWYSLTESEVHTVRSERAKPTNALQHSWSRSLCAWFAIAASGCALAVMVWSCAITVGLAEADSRPIRLMLDGQLLQEDIAAVMVEGVLMVPLTPLIDALGAEFEYDVENGLVTISFGARRPVAEPGQALEQDAQAGDIVVFVAKTGDKYHVQGCRYLSSGGEAITLDAAEQRGYLPCKVCNPPKRSVE